MVSEEAQILIKKNGCTIPMLRKVAEDNRILQPDIHPEHYNAFIETMPDAKTIKDLHLTIEEFELIEREMHFYGQIWRNQRKHAKEFNSF